MTASVLDSAYTSLKKKNGGKNIRRSDMEAVWTSLGLYISKTLKQGKSICIPKFGTFSCLEGTPKKSTENVLTFGADFLGETGTRQKRGGMVKSAAPKLTYTALSRESQRSKDACKSVVESMLWSLSFSLIKNSSFLELEFPELGKLVCKGRNLSFVFLKPNSNFRQVVESDEEKSEEESVYEYAEPSPVFLKQKPNQVSLIPSSVDRLREKVISRGGAAGIHALSRTLKIMDSSGDGSLDKEEFKYGLQDFGIRINVAELDEMFRFFDRDRSGKVSFDEFLTGLRGPMSQRRIDLIKLAFRKLDATGDGVVTIEDIEVNYNADFDPDVKSGRKSSAEALRAYLAQFDSIDQDGIVTEEEFLEYYKNVSGSIDDDDYFELMIRNAWHLSGGKGQYENTTCRRVLVTHADGRQTVEEIKDDLFVRKDDKEEMKRRLGKGNVELGLTYSNDATAKATRAKPNLKATRTSLKPSSRKEPEFQIDAGDESIAPAENAMGKLGKILLEKRLSVDDFLQKIGANRVFGDATITNSAFIRGVTAFDSRISAKDAKEICRIADADGNGSIDVPELCTHVKGAGAIERIKSCLKSRGEGIHGLTRTLRIMDTGHEKCLDRSGVLNGFKTLGLKLTSHDIEDIFSYFDRDKNGVIDIDEFLIGLRGELNTRRSSLVMLAFNQLDRTQDGAITFEDIETFYDVTQHPDFISGAKKKRQILDEFLNNFDRNNDATISSEEFLDYYKSVSCSIDDDDYFELMIRNAWHISGGKGQYENTTCKRVLITDSKGRQTVQQVKDDFFARKPEEIRGKLDLDPTSKVETHYANSGPKPSRSSRKKIPPKKQENNWFTRAADNTGDESLPGEPISSSRRTSSGKPAGPASSGHWFARAQDSTGDEYLRGSSARVTLPADVSSNVGFRTRAEPLVLQKLRDKVVTRGGSNGIHTLGRVLRIMDDSGDKLLDRSELKNGLEDYGVECTDQELSQLFSFLDTDKSGKISFDEFLVGIRGPMNPRRLGLVSLAFKKLDRTGDGVVTLEDLEMSYDASHNPDVKSGKLSKAEGLREFLNQFDTIDQDGIVTEEEFAEYYKNVSGSIDGDDYFELMMRNAWHISGGKGQYENTTCRRVLVTDSTGRQTVQEVKDDLYMNDPKAMKQQLKRQGVDVKGDLGMHYTDAQKPPTRKLANQSTLSLAWGEQETSQQKVKSGIERERKIRQGAAVRVQTLLRAKKATTTVSLEKRKKKLANDLSRDAENQRAAQANRIIRPSGSNWY